VADIEMIGVPFDGYGRAGHQAHAAGALRDAGLRDAFDHHHVIDDDDLALPDPDPTRGPSTSLINEPALLAMTEALNRKVGSAVGAGRFPFVYGGDCSMLLGIVTGLRDHVGDVGLVFIDGHEDTMPLDVSEDGEAANTEIGLLLGLTGRLLTGELGERLPALGPEQLVILGPRDDAWRQQFNVGTLADSGVWMAPLAEVADNPAGTGRRAIEQLSAQVNRWWLHIDLDVLDPAEFRAQGLPDVDDEPGGLTWDQLTDLVMALFTGPGSCVGGSLAIYDPDQDPDGAAAAQIVEFVRNVLVRPTISP
jgi:arginase